MQFSNKGWPCFFVLFWVACCPNFLEAQSENRETIQRKSIVIGVDGLRSDQIGKTKTPNLDKLIREGATCLSAKNCWTPSKAWNGHSATNWGVLLTGVNPDEAELTANGDGEHLVNDNSIFEDDSEDPKPVLSFFGHLKKSDTEFVTAVFNTWSGIGVADATILQNSDKAIDYHLNPKGDSASQDRDKITVRSAIDLLESSTNDDKKTRRDVDCTFIHISQCDAAGHAHTWDSDEYRIAVSQVDGLIGDLMTTIAERPSRKQERWLIIVTTDHGGPADAKDHADNDNLEINTIPLIVWKDGIEPRQFDGGSLYDVAPTVLDWMKVHPEIEFRGNIIHSKPATKKKDNR